MLQLFDKGVQIAMGQAHVKRWIDDLMPLVTDDSDPLGVRTCARTGCRSTRRRTATRSSRRSSDGAIKIVLQP